MKDEDIIERAEAFYPKAREYWDPIHQAFTEDKRFVKSPDPDDQWDADALADRRMDNPPRLTLTHNLLNPFVNQVVNDIRQSHIGIQVKPRAAGRDKVLAEIRQGIIRSIENNSGGQQAYYQACDDQVTGGYGAFRIITDFADPQAFEKEIKFRPVDDPTRVFMGDGMHQEPDYSDVTDALVYEPYTKEQFKREVKKDPEAYMGTSDISGLWGNANGPWVVEYWFKEHIPDTLVKAIDGKDYFLSEIKDQMEASALEMGLESYEDLIAKDESGEIITRETHRCQVWMCKMAGREVLKKEKWPGYWIPIFIVNGRRVVLEGKTELVSLTRYAKEQQKAHNYGFSLFVERLSFAPKSPVMAALEGIPKGHKENFENANTFNGTIFFKAFDDEGRPLPPPQRLGGIGSDPGLLELQGITERGVKSAIGMFESAIGQKGQAVSGVAKRQEEMQSDTANFDWGYNLAIAVKHAGRVINELLPKVIDTPRQVRMVGEDDKEKVVQVNQVAQDERGQDYYYDLNEGKYDIDVRVGPSATTKRQETTESMQALFQNSPMAAELLGDIFVQEQDWRLSDQAADRIKKALAMKYPGLITEAQGEPPAVAQMRQQLQQLQAQMQALGAENQAMKTDKAIEMQRLQLDGQKMQIDWFNAQTNRAKVEMDAQAKTADTAQKARADEMDFKSTLITAGMNHERRNEGVAAPSQPGARG